ncbi:MAG: type II secretion system secretin GspD [Pseudomonadota bacterium]
MTATGARQWFPGKKILGRRSRHWLALMGVVVLQACTEPEAIEPDFARVETQSLPVLSGTENARDAILTAGVTNEPRVRRQDGTGEFLNTDRAFPFPAPPLRIDALPNGEFAVNLVNVPVLQAAEAVLGETLGLAFVVSPDAQGLITVLASRPIPSDALLDSFQAALEVNGLELVLTDGTYTVQRQPEEFRRVRPIGRPGFGGRTVYAFPLQYISAAEMIRILEPLASPSARLVPLANRNIVLAAGSDDDIDAIVDAVDLFDVNTLAGKSLSLVTGLTVNPVTIVDELNIVFDTGEGGALQQVLTFVPNQELGSILIISTQKSYVRDAEAWIRSYEASAGREVQTAIVYQLNNRTAVDLAPVLNRLLSFGTLNFAGGVAVDGPAGEDPAGFVEVDGEIDRSEGTARIIPDDVSNSILAYATPAEHNELKNLIDRLDSVANQVLLEAIIADVQLTDELDFGVQWFLRDGNFAFNFSSGAAAATAASVTAGLPGFNAIFSAGNASVALNALASITDLNVISAPSLLVLDNREAELNIGSQVPIATQSSTSTTDANAPVVNSITQLETGVILRIKPRVSDDGRVILDIYQEVSDAVTTTTSNIDSPTVNQSVVTTSVAVDHGQSVAIGGLIRTSVEERRSKVPFLGDIPLFGAAFRNTDDKDQRRELLIIITPTVIRDASEARRATDEYRSRLSDRLGRTPPVRTNQNKLERIFR